MAQRLDAREASFPKAFAALLSAKREVSEDVDQAVRAIIEEVMVRGDEALIDFTLRFDGLALQPETLRISMHSRSTWMAPPSAKIKVAVPEGALVSSKAMARRLRTASLLVWSMPRTRTPVTFSKCMQVSRR